MAATAAYAFRAQALTIAATAKSGDLRQILVALRNRIAKAIDVFSARPNACAAC
jgi:hypothetical protein